MAVGEGSGPVSLENGASGAVGRRGRGRSSSGSMYAFLQRPEIPMVSLEVARAAVGDCGVAVEDKTGALQVRGVEIREEIDENVDDRIADGQDAASTGNGKKVQKCGFQLNWKTQHNNKNYGNAQNSEEHRSLACSSESHELVNTEMTGPIMRTEISPEISRGSSEVQALNPELLAYNGSVPVAGDATTLPPNVLEDIGQNVGELEICHENKFEQRGVIVDHFTVTGEMKEETSGSANTRQLTNLPAKEDDFFMPSSRKRKIPQEDVMTAESKMQPASKARVSKRQQRRLEIEPQQTIIRALPGRKKKATATPAAGAEEPVRENKSSSGMDHDLRKDARLAAEENARLSAGKPIHPFFVRHRPVQQSNMDVESTFGEDILIEPSLPRHVTQNAEEQVNWNSCGLRVLECKSKPKLLEDDDWTCSSLKCKDGCSSFLVSIRECFTFAAPPDQSLVQLLEYLKVSSAKANEVVANEVVANEVVSDTYPLERLKEKYGWYCARSSVDANIAIKGSPKKNCARRFLDGALNALWTDVYQPQSSQQVCGNEDSVKFLNDWLYSWQLKILSERKSEGTPEKTKNSKMDSDRGWFQDDSDSDGPLIDSNELQNTLLLTGPVGCGKSAAVYACANEQGFDVIEINASDIRTGALIKHKFGEAFESHGLNKWSCLDADTKYKCADGKFTNARARLQWDQSVNHEKSSTDSLSFSEFQRGKMTLILFEEVDTVFDEDKGFMAALVQLAKTAKRPIILTSNRREPLLPQLEKIKVNFRRPAVEDMVVHACLVCTSSGVPGNPWLIERLVRSCQQDIRKLMTLLQFWGQGFCLSEKGNQRKPSMGSERNLSYQGCLLKDSLQLCTGIQNPAFNNDLKQPLQVLPGANHLVVSQAGDNSQSLVAHIAGGYRKWLPQALWCFESDAQYCLLPQLFPFSFPCPLAGSVAEKVSVAVQEAVEIAIIASEQSAKSAALLKADLARASRKEKRSLKKMLEFESSKATEIEENRDICFTSIQEQLKPHDMSHEGKRKSHVKRKMVLHESDDDSKLDCDVLPQNIVESLGQGTNDGSSMEGDPNFKRKFETSQNLANLKLRGSRKFKRLQKLSQNEEATTIAASDQKFQVGGPTELTLSVGDLSDVQALCFQQNHNFADSDIGLDEKGSAGYLDPVKRHWLEVADSLKSSSFSCSKCYHVAALKINCALADFEDTLSCCDVMSSIPNSVDDSRNAEVAAQLAHANLHYFAEVSNETVELLAPDRGTNPQEGAQLFYTSPCHEQNLLRQQRHTRLKEALFFPNPRKARIGLTEPSFCDYTSYMARIATLEDLGKVERLGRKQRRGSPHYLSDLGVPEEGIHALRQLSAFGDPLIH